MKTRRIFLILVVMASILICNPSLSDARAVPPTSNAMSGGHYLLTGHTAADPQPAGYRLLDAGTKADEASGCCCKNFVPCMIR